MAIRLYGRRHPAARRRLVFLHLQAARRRAVRRLARLQVALAVLLAAALARLA
jgi:hypothetical protein